VNDRAIDTTVVIPTYERVAVLLETLRALVKVRYPRGQWEAVVVDDGSGHETLATIGRWIKEAGAPVRLLRQAHRGPAAARNLGAREAVGDVLIFLDNDCLVPLEFIERHLHVLKTNPESWVVGRLVHPQALQSTPFGRYRDDCWEAFHRSHPEGLVSETAGMTAANLALPAADFARLGGFDEGFSIASCEDWDLAWRARAAGIRVLYDPCNVAVHNDWAVGLDQFCERQRLYSISDVLLWRKYGEQSPRARLVRENSPVGWTVDSPSLILKKTVKRLLATRPGRAMVSLACAAAERMVSDTWLSRRAYQLAVSSAIFRGVREGLIRYDGPSTATGAGMARDASAATPRSSLP
jgi:GT2 family glycosyltransferase